MAKKKKKKSKKKRAPQRARSLKDALMAVQEARAKEKDNGKYRKLCTVEGILRHIA